MEHPGSQPRPRHRIGPTWPRLKPPSPRKTRPPAPTRHARHHRPRGQLHVPGRLPTDNFPPPRIPRPRDRHPPCGRTAHTVAGEPRSGVRATLASNTARRSPNPASPNAPHLSRNHGGGFAAREIPVRPPPHRDARSAPEPLPPGLCRMAGAPPSPGGPPPRGAAPRPSANHALMALSPPPSNSAPTPRLRSRLRARLSPCRGCVRSGTCWFPASPCATRGVWPRDGTPGSPHSSPRPESPSLAPPDAPAAAPVLASRHNRDAEPLREPGSSHNRSHPCRLPTPAAAKPHAAARGRRNRRRGRRGRGARRRRTSGDRLPTLPGLGQHPPVSRSLRHVVDRPGLTVPG